MTGLPWLRFEADFKTGSQVLRIFFLRVSLGSPAEKSSPEHREHTSEASTPREKRKQLPTLESTKTERKTPPTPETPRKQARKPKRDRGKRTRHRLWIRFKSVWQERELAKTISTRLLRIIIRIIKAGRIDYLKLRLRLATGDPMLTGVLYGIIQSVNWIDFPRTEIAVTPDFDSSSPEAEFSGSISIRLIRVVFIMATGLLSLPWIKMYRTRRRLRTVFAEGVS